jgi:mitochondrial chaperone BCS1
MTDLLDTLSHHPLLSGGIALAAGGMLVGWLRRIPSMGLAAIRRRLVFTVEVSDRDQCYAWFQQWFNERPEMKRSRNVVAKTQWGNYQTQGSYASLSAPVPHGYASGSVPVEKPRINLMGAPATYLIRHEGRPVVATWTRRELMSNGSVAGFAESLTFRFFGSSRQRVESMLAEVAAIGEEPPKGIQVYIAAGEGWRPSDSLARRSPESLSLVDGLFDDIVGDIRTFLASARWYADRGIPHRRGFLLYGPPGTGKTTLPQVVAGQLGLSLATLSLGDPAISDATLRFLFEQLGRNVMLVIEDIDCVFRERDATSDKIGVTLSGLLNVLDGIGSKEGRILFMTTNHPERLDPALVRPGRIDRKVELGYASETQAARMFRWFFAGHPLGGDGIDNLADRFADRLESSTAPAAIQEHLLRHRDDPAEAVRTFGDDGEEIDILPAIDARLNGHAAHAMA